MPLECFVSTPFRNPEESNLPKYCLASVSLSWGSPRVNLRTKDVRGKAKKTIAREFELNFAQALYNDKNE